MLAPGAEEEKFRPVELPLSEIEERLRYLTPLQFPSKRHLVFPAGAEWTAHIRNSGHGDSSAWVWNRSRNLACRGVLATHVPASQYPYPSTQIELFGPTGRPPLGSVRSISAGIYDEGHWRFDQSGKPLPFEELDAYRERLIRDRFTRPMLIRYLSALGIDVDDRATYGREGTLFKSLSAYKPRTVRLSDWRAENGDG